MNNEENKKYVKAGITAIAVVLVSLLCFFLLFRLKEISDGLGMIFKILQPFLYGAIFAYILTPVCNRLEQLLGKIFPKAKDKGKLLGNISIVISMILALAVIWFLIILLIPQLINSIIAIANAIPGQLSIVNHRLHDFLQDRPKMQNYWDSFADTVSKHITQWLKSNLLPTMETVIVNLGSSVALFVTIIKNLFIGLLICVYFLLSRQRFAVQAKMLLYGVFPKKAATVIEDELHYTDKMFNGFLMGKLMDSAIIGVICFIVTTIFRFPSAALISVIVGVTNIIPFFGPFIGAIPCALLLLLESPIYCLYFLIFIVVLQQIDGNLIGPKILGNTTGISSFWVLFSILLFGGLWGLLGMIIGVPLFAVLYDIIRRLIYIGLHKHESVSLIEQYEQTFHQEPAPKEKKQRKRKKKK